MHKKILLVEQSDATRGVAETLLRQNGFDVVGVQTAERAMEVLKFGRPDLIVAGSELIFMGKPFYQQITEREDAEQLRLIVVHDSNEPAPAAPSEMVITRPFDPRLFLQKVQAFTDGKAGQMAPPVKNTAQDANPLGGASLDDEFLDAALGLDGIEVTDSEVMNRTGVSIKKKTAGDEMVGMSEVGESAGLSDSGRVESVIVSDSSTDIRRGGTKKTPIPVSGTGKLDILDDQFGLTNPKGSDPEPEAGDHDYAWFVGEMQKGDTIDKTDDNTDHNLTFTDPSQSVDPVTDPVGVSQPKKKSSDSGGVEKFIDEFKKEVEKFQADEPESVTLQPENDLSNPWEDSIEAVTPEQVAIFTREFTASLAEKVAEKIAAKIDADKLLKLIKTELMKKKKQG